MNSLDRHLVSTVARLLVDEQEWVESCVQKVFCVDLLCFLPSIQSFTMEIPIIDLYNLVNANSSLEVTSAIRKACLDFGFFYVVNHGIADDLQAKVLEKLWQFFNLSVSKKEEIHRRDGFRGYFSKEEEHSIEYGCTEWKEGIYYFRDFTNVPKERKETIFCGFNPWPSGEYVPEFQEVMQEYFKRTQELASKLLSCIALSLGINTLSLFHTDLP